MSQAATRAAALAVSAACLALTPAPCGAAQSQAPMDAVMGTLQRPDQVRIRLLDGALLEPAEAIRYLEVNGFIVKTGDAEIPYRTTDLYKTWAGAPRLQYVIENLASPSVDQKVFLSNGQILGDSGVDYLVSHGYMEEVANAPGKYVFTAKYEDLKKLRGKYWGDVREISGYNIHTTAEFQKKYPEIVITAPTLHVRFRAEAPDHEHGKLEIEPKTIVIDYAWYYYCKHSPKQPDFHTEGCKVNTRKWTCTFQEGDYLPKALEGYPASFGGAWGAKLKCTRQSTTDGKPDAPLPELNTGIYEQYGGKEKAFLLRIHGVDDSEWLLR